MYIKVIDGKPVFATHLVEYDGEIQTKEIFAQKEQNKFICYSKEECSCVIKKLKNEGAKYKIVSLLNAKITENNNLTYKSRSEAIEHLQNNNKPKHLKEKKLEKELEILKKQVSLIMDKLGIKY